MGVTGVDRMKINEDILNTSVINRSKRLKQLHWKGTKMKEENKKQEEENNIEP